MFSNYLDMVEADWKKIGKYKRKLIYALMFWILAYRIFSDLHSIRSYD